MCELLIIFPTNRQIEYLIKIEYHQKIFILLQDQLNFKYLNDKHLVFLCKDDFEQIQYLYKKELTVLCCHEEAVYWLKENLSIYWHYNFSKEYFEILDKINFKRFLIKNDILCADYTLDINMVNHYPLIAKPSIGFGSIGVMNIKNRSDAKNYINNFDTMIQNSAIYKYQKKYFPNIKNQFLFEEKINGNFYRTSVIVKNGVCVNLFPVYGISPINKKYSDFHWEEFELDLNDKNINKFEMKNIVNKLIGILRLGDGVFIIEFIQNSNNEILLLEFSPRQTSERISKLIYLATGIDIELYAINAFLKNESIDKDLHETQIVRLRLENQKNQLNDIPKGYYLLNSENDTSLYDNNINLRYYKKL